MNEQETEIIGAYRAEVMDQQQARRVPKSDRAILPKVSVCCAWYNRADYVRDTVDSLLSQDFNRFEIVLINDGSSDPRVKEILDSYNDHRLRVIHQENMGFVGAIRRAIEESSGEYVAIQGAGDMSLPERLREQWAFMSSNPHVVAIGCVHEHVTARNGRRLGRRNGEVVASSKLLRSAVPFTHGTLFMRRSAYMQVGGYNPLFQFSQDLELYKRLITVGTVLRIDKCLYRKFLFDDGASSNPKKSLVQAKYRHLLRIQDIDDDKYRQLCNLIRAGGIDAAIPTHEIIADCRRRQRALILKGELGMAVQWGAIIQSADPSDRVQKYICPFLSFCAKNTMIEGAIGRFLEVGIATFELLKWVASTTKRRLRRQS